MHLTVFIIAFAAWISISTCSLDNDDNAGWEASVERDVDDAVNDVSEDITMKREEASQFLERTRRGLNHECYAECCNWEEVREHYEHDIPAADNYWKNYKDWGYRNNRCTHTFGR